MARYRPARKRRPTMHELTPEASLQQAQAQAASLLGYYYFHVPDSRMMNPGLPDTIILGHGRLIFWENKVTGATPTHVQADVLAELQSLEGPPLVQLVYPRDLDTCLVMLKEFAGL